MKMPNELCNTNFNFDQNQDKSQDYIQLTNQCMKETLNR